ncbi:MAG TPA: CHC2 zinc finger domain-containing protein [Xanthobacteraceae bacterium]|nr:CHC2 zinc finger domain-containing protein [Xanthobacteraceae bacterium]
MTRSPEFEQWVQRAREVSILDAAVARGAQLKRAGREYFGPCVHCAGRDRFSINVVKQIFNCRGSVGGDVIKMVEHLDGVSFMEAVQTLTGEPPPGAEAKPLSDAEKQARERRRRQNEAAQRAREEQDEADETRQQEKAAGFWRGAKPIAGTLAEVYLNARGIPTPDDGWPDCFRFTHLEYGFRGPVLPVLVCKVLDLEGEFAAIWRIYLSADGRSKADVPNPKLGLGPASGGAVRIGGGGDHIGIAEGVETALGAWCLIGRRYPVWAALSTSGMAGFEPPLGVGKITIFPDGDRSIRKQGEDYVPVACPPGRKAAQALQARMMQARIKCITAAEPVAGTDYLDLWNASQLEPV